MRLLKIRSVLPIRGRIPLLLLWGLLWGLPAPACTPDAEPPEPPAEVSEGAPVGDEAGAQMGTPGEVEPPAAGEGSDRRDALPERDDSLPLVLFMGTSLTEGLGLEDPDREAWPARVEERAREAGMDLRFRNAGLSGETSAGALRRIDWILDEAPAVAVLETGANDGLRGLPVEELEANLDSILSRIQDRAPEVRLVLAGMEAPPNLGREYVDAFRAVFPRVAARWGAALIPFLLEGVAGDEELNQADRIHPNAEGHNRMAEEAWPVLEEVLEEVAKWGGEESARVPGASPSEAWGG